LREVSNVADIDPELRKDYEYFQKAKKDWLAEHSGKYALVKGGKLIGVFDTDAAAYAEGVKRFGNTSMLIARIQPQESIVWIPALQLGLTNARI